LVSETRLTAYGDFAANFIEERLEKLCDPSGGVQTGPFGSQLHQHDYVPIGTPIITVEHLGENRILHQGVPLVSDDDKERLSKYTLRKGDIVFSRVGSVDRRALVTEAEEGWLFSGRCLRVRPDPNKIDSVYLSYFFGLPSFKEHIRAIAVGATMPSLNTEILSNVVVLYPPDLNEQRAIARILSSLDDKIELNRRMNQTLEAMARAIFKSWFVDFDPVRAKADGREPEGMDADTAALFPDGFEDSDIGEIPKGWIVRSIGDVVNVLGGGTPSTIETSYWEGGIHSFCTPKDMSSLTSPILLNTERHLTDKGLVKVSSGQLPIGTVLMSSRAPIGYLAISEIPVSINQGIIAMVCDKDLPNLYVLNWAQTNMEGFIAVANGSTFLEISKWNFRPIKVLVPPTSILKEFMRAIDPVYLQITNNAKQSLTLEELRNAILPRLISGEIPVNGRDVVP